jgi:uncharacterized protein YukE
MNKARREAIEKVAEQLSDLKDAIEALRDEEQDYFDNMPESFQGGEKGEAAESAISELDDAASSVEAAFDSLMNAIQN